MMRSVKNLLDLVILHSYYQLKVLQKQMMQDVVQVTLKLL